MALIALPHLFIVDKIQCITKALVIDAIYPTNNVEFRLNEIHLNPFNSIISTFYFEHLYNVITTELLPRRRRRWRRQKLIKISTWFVNSIISYCRKQVCAQNLFLLPISLTGVGCHHKGITELIENKNSLANFNFSQSTRPEFKRTCRQKWFTIMVNSFFVFFS